MRAKGGEASGGEAASGVRCSSRVALAILLDSARIEENRRFAPLEATPKATSRSDHRSDIFDYP